MLNSLSILTAKLEARERGIANLTQANELRQSSLDLLIEQMEERLYDDIGECVCDVFSGVTPEAKLELDAFLLAWVEKNSDLSRYWKIVGGSRECKLTAEDLA